jgi:pre-mRNA-splicing factor 18
MVGIHSRSAREKIQATHTAHVMNDETQRKYLQSIKRLITYAQKRHPTLPSQMVLHWNYDKSKPIEESKAKR